MTGFEPATPTLARLCATNCATSACFERVRRSLRSTTIVHSRAAPQIPTTRANALRSDASMWQQLWSEDVPLLGTRSVGSTRPSTDLRKAVANQEIRQARLDRVTAGLPAAQPGHGERRLPVPDSAPVRDNVPRRSPVILRCTHGLVAQWESVRLTRGRSLVRYQPGPPVSPILRMPFLSRWAITWTCRPGPVGPTVTTAQTDGRRAHPTQSKACRVRRPRGVRRDGDAATASAGSRCPTDASALSSARCVDASPGERRRRRVAHATTGRVARRRRCVRTRRTAAAPFLHRTAWF